MFELKVKRHFDAAHFLQSYVGKCNRMHGHRWEVEVEIHGPIQDLNMIVDFSIVKDLMEKSIERLDHYVLNDQLNEMNPTAEYLAVWFFGQLYSPVEEAQSGLLLASVTIWESPECSVRFTGEEDHHAAQ